MLKQYLETGKIVTTHGLKGEVKVYPWCDDAEELLDFDVLYLNKGKTALEVEDAWVQNGNMVIMKFAGIDVIEKAQELRGKVLYIDRDDVELEEGQHFVQDLLGMEVVDADDGHVYGKLTDVSKTGANDVYHITFPDGKVRLIPKIPQVVIDIDVEAEKMTIRPLEGLFDDEN